MASQGPSGLADTSFCRECGKPIEADAHFCRFCGKPQQVARTASSTTSAPPAPASPVASPRPATSPRPAAPRGSVAAGTSGSVEEWLRQLFPRDHRHDEFMLVGTVAAFFMFVIGFLLGLFTPALGGDWLSTDFLLSSIALTLFLILRGSTLNQVRPPAGPDGARANPASRPQGVRAPMPAASDIAAEAATTQSTPSRSAAAEKGAPAP